jgi:hypothetical protein
MKPEPPDHFQVVSISGAALAPDVDLLSFSVHLGWREVYLHMMQIAPTEMDLNAGRFLRFSRYRQSCRVLIRDEPLAHAPRLAFNGRIADWISANTHSRWSFFIDYRHMGDYTTEWNFESSADAIIFKLTWG